MQNPVGWFEIYVDDMTRAKAFYQSVLEVELTAITDPTEESFAMWGFPSDMEAYGASGALVHCKGFQVGKNSTLVYFACEDCAVEESRVEAAGGTVQRPKMSLGEHGYCSLVLDTEGNLFGLHSMN